MRGFDHATILSPSFHGLCLERLAQCPPPPICVQNTTKNLLQIISPAAYLSGTKNSDNRKKNLKNPQILG